MKSYIELHLRLLESYQVKRLLDIPNNCKVIRKKCKTKDRFVIKDVLTNSKVDYNKVAMLESKGYSLIDPY